MHKTLIEMDPVTDRQFWSSVQRQRGLLRQRTTNRQTSWDRLTVDAVVTAVCNGTGATGSSSGSLIVLVDVDSLVDGERADSLCETDSGVPVPVSTARRMACEAGILPMVLNGAGVVLDEGRARRRTAERIPATI